MPKFKVSIDEVVYYESAIIEADCPEKALDIYRERLEYGSTEPIDHDFMNERAERVEMI